MSKHGKATLIPQRHNGKCWTMCSEHQASAYLVVRANGTKVARYASKAEARDAQARADRVSSKETRGSYSLGSRMPARIDGAEPVARSLTREQYLKAKGLDA